MYVHILYDIAQITDIRFRFQNKFLTVQLMLSLLHRQFKMG